MNEIISLKGMKDYYGNDLLILNFIKDTFFKFYQSLGYQAVFTPLIEYEALFNRSLGEETDIVQKEMFQFFTKSNKKIVLRPENTASILRFIWEKKLYYQKNLKFLYFGPMFRYERPQKNRYRQFFQLGCEAFSSKNSFFDSSLLINLINFLSYLGISNYKLHINCLPDKQFLENYQTEVKKYFKNYLHELCTDCNLRINKNPLRILDCKIDNWKDFYNFAPKSIDFCSSDSQKYFFEIKEILKTNNVEYITDDKLVRGLDYYNDLIFELKNEETTFVAGGRYNNLFHDLYSVSLPGIGFSIGCERLIKVIQENEANNINFQKYKKNTLLKKVLFLVLEENLINHFFSIYQKFLKFNLDFDEKFQFFWSFKKETLKKGLTFALKNNFSFVIIYGNNNFNSNSFTVKKIMNNKDAKTNNNFDISINNLSLFFKNKISE
ncbi:histidine--tRNA ligase [symbiont of Argiope bruennichi]|uniref:histidine--tRNA ligase n=1 Tax=symbiont of Argiope bruennichi TaxID=2810479 RepID=UPI003DA41A26